MATAQHILPNHEPDSWGRFRTMLEDVSVACSRAARRAESRDRAGLLMAAALLRIAISDIDRSLRGAPRVWRFGNSPDRMEGSERIAETPATLANL